MNKFMKIGALVCAIIILVACIYFGYSYYTTKEQLTDVQRQMNTVQNNLNAESEKLASTQDELNRANEIIASREGEVYFVDCEVTEYEIDMIAKTVWGEARGSNKLQQSAVVWCILNRVDKRNKSIAQIITAKNQFHGYSSSFPITDEIKALVKDVVARWKLEKIVCGDVGRTLPKDYTYFRAGSDGRGNVFRNKYSGDYDVWDWDCWNPYS